MCLHGNTRMVKLKIPREVSGRLEVPIDSCIANEVERLIEIGVITIGSCCGHREPGQYPHVLIKEESCLLAVENGYKVKKYYHGLNDFRNVYEIKLKESAEAPSLFYRVELPIQ